MTFSYGAAEASLAGLSGDDAPPELADLRRFGRRVVRRFVAQARADDAPRFSTLIAEHLGTVTDELPVVVERWPAYEHVNVQRALDAWLAEPGRTSRLVGMVNYRHRGDFGLADLLGNDPDSFHDARRPGNVARVTLPTGPDGETLECLSAAVLLVTQGSDRIALLVRGPDREEGNGATVEAVASRDGLAAESTAALRELSLRHNVYRGHVVSFGTSMFGERGSLLRFHRRQRLDERDVILPPGTFEDLRRQVVGVARHRDRLRASGQHLKRGLLLYGPPGVGKTHTVRYLVGKLTDTTVVELTGESLGAIKEACSIARALTPAMIVIEDVDLIAEQRDHYGGSSPVLFSLLNEMDGLDEDADVVFVLTTNRADLLEPALASRPGRVDQAVHIDLPDADSRRRLIELYRGLLDLDTTRLDGVLARTEGVTASFLKELLRRAAVVAAERDESSADEALSVTAEDLDRALDELLDTRHRMTRVVLGVAEDEASISR